MRIFNRKSVHQKDCVCAKCIIDKDKEKNDITTNAKMVIEEQISESVIAVAWVPKSKVSKDIDALRLSLAA